MNELALFAGAGGGILGGRLLGWRTRCAVEIDAYARSVLISRQRDGCLDLFPVWDDVRTFDGRPWRGAIDVISGGFPCQDISVAGAGAGIEGPRSGLWKEFARIIGEVGPRFVLVENSPALTGRGLGTVLGDLATLGYDAKWGVLGAHHAGAPHRRDRIWIVANTVRLGGGEGLAQLESEAGPTTIRERRIARAQPRNGCEVVSDSNEFNDDHTGHGPGSVLWKRSKETELSGCGEVSNSNSPRLEDWGHAREPKGPDEGQRGMAQSQPERRSGAWWSVEPELGRVAHGVANRVDRIRAIGNGQVPAVVKLAWDTLQ